MESTQLVSGQGVSNVSIGRHQSQCTICQHPDREKIENDYLQWTSITDLARSHGVSRDSLYRHVHALGLDKKRSSTILLPLERLIERGDWAKLTGATVLKAIQFYMKVTGAGQEVKAVEGAGAKEVLQRMSQEEREAFARDGSIPDWISGATDATPDDGQEDAVQSVATKNETLQ
jgi:hypothetical protein